jgi:hypothetical protein
MSLWGRHTPKFVQLGTYRYALLQPSNSHPENESLYVLNSADTIPSWKLLRTITTNTGHQPGSLLLVGNNLHVIYPYQDVGTVEHFIIAGASTGAQAAPVKVNTDVWGRDNYYFGAATDGTNVYLCSNNWVGDRFRCARFQNGVWGGPVNTIATYPDHQYLYPSMVPFPGGFWLFTSAFPKSSLHIANGDRDRSMAVKVTFTGASMNASPTVLGGYNANGLDTTVFENDATSYNGTTYMLGTAELDSQDYLFSIPTSGTGAQVKKTLTPFKGASYNIYVDASGIWAVGSGFIRHSTDFVNWTLTPFEIPGYPKTDFSYWTAHIVKERSGTPNGNTIRVLQEVSNKSTKTQTVIELEFLRN